MSIQEWTSLGDSSVQWPDGSPRASDFQATFPAYCRQRWRDSYWLISKYKLFYWLLRDKEVTLQLHFYHCFVNLITIIKTCSSSVFQDHLKKNSSYTLGLLKLLLAVEEFLERLLFLNVCYLVKCNLLSLGIWNWTIPSITCTGKR